MECSVKLKYLEYTPKINGETVHIFCPILEDGISRFGIYREVYKEFKELLNQLFEVSVDIFRLNLKEKENKNE